MDMIVFTMPGTDQFSVTRWPKEEKPITTLVPDGFEPTPSHIAVEHTHFLATDANLMPYYYENINYFDFLNNLVET